MRIGRCRASEGLNSSRPMQGLGFQTNLKLLRHAYVRGYSCPALQAFNDRKGQKTRARPK